MTRRHHAIRPLLALTAILWVASTGAPRAEPVTLIRNNGPSANRVDLVILGDGYTSAEIASGKYAADVELFVTRMFSQEPYTDYQTFYNVRRVDVISAESGADHPATDILRNTALDAAYDCSGIQRLVCVNTSKVNTVLTNSGVTGNARDAVLVIVNDAEYGGSGGSLAVASINAAAVEIILHELGHSFALLADEYGGPPPPSCNASIEPSAPNATRDTNRASIKWGAWIAASTPLPTTSTAAATPGAYQGAQYCDAGLFRPTFNSKMRSLNAPFEQINTEAHVRRIYNLVSPVDGFSPSASALSIPATQAQPFSVTLLRPISHELEVTWRIDGVRRGGGLLFVAAGLTAGIHIITATVHDQTPFVRSDPSNLLTETIAWNITVTGTGVPRNGWQQVYEFRPTTPVPGSPVRGPIRPTMEVANAPVDESLVKPVSPKRLPKLPADDTAEIQISVDSVVWETIGTTSPLTPEIPEIDVTIDKRRDDGQPNAIVVFIRLVARHGDGPVQPADVLQLMVVRIEGSQP